MRRAIVTGATGAIGVALINRLLKEDIDVLVFCNKNSSREDHIPQSRHVQVRRANLDEYVFVNNDLDEKYDIFFHLAWAGTVGSQRDDLYLQMENVRHAVDAVDMAKRFGCDTFVGIGSQAEYGRKFEKLTSNTMTNPESGYGIAKLSAGFMTKHRARSYGMKHLWVRVLSVYGPCDGMGSLINYTISELLQDKEPELTKGEQIWDFLYSDDAAEALWKLAEKGKNGQVYVLGSGEEKTLAEYLEQLGKIVSPGMRLVFGKRPYADKQVMYLSADLRELNQDTGFLPQVSFEDGIKRTMEWIKKHEAGRIII